MQLHPKDNTYWNKEEELLKTQQIIGMDGAENSQLKQFQESMEINDIVLIKRGRQAIALVKVVSNSEENLPNQLDDDLNWFTYKRNIEILDFYDFNQLPNIQLPAVRLSKSVNPVSELFIFIDNWYLSLKQKKYNQNSLVSQEYKIQNVFIHNFKMFKDFELNLLDQNDKPLPLVVLAGKNGTGKTSILEHLYGYSFNENDYIEIFRTRKAEEIDVFIDDEIIVESFRLQKGMKAILEKKSEYRDHIVYLPVKVGETGNVEDQILDHYIERAQNIDSFKKSLEELQTYIQNIFNNLELSFNISRIDYTNKKVFFKNTNNQEFDISALSTGEKTLVSKVLYLYLNNLKNKIILIDEPELSLHPAWQNKILKLYENFAKANNCQIIIATHSPHIIANSPYNYLRLLSKKNEKIVAKSLNSSPLDSDTNAILRTIMDADYIPEGLDEIRLKYRKLCLNNQINSPEAEQLKQEILKFESLNSSFFQGLAFDMELLG